MSYGLFWILSLERCVVEWFELLGYKVEDRRKVMSSNPDLAIRLLKNSFYQPDCKWVSVSSQGSMRCRKERNGLHLPHAAPKMRLASNPNCPCGHKTIRNFPFSGSDRKWKK